MENDNRNEDVSSKSCIVLRWRRFGEKMQRTTDSLSSFQYDVAVPHMNFIAMIDEKMTNQFVLTFKSSDLLWRKRPPEKPPWICDGEEALETEARSLMLFKNEFSRIYILIQYIWYQSIMLKSPITSWKTRQHQGDD
ncbi:hypothetical protein YC2023_106973 [Brassica napus]